MKAGSELFTSTVRSLLAKNCLECHGGAAVKGDFDLSSRAKLMASGFVEPGNDESHLLELIRHETEPHMPHKRDKLPDKAISAIARWIKLGAPYDKPLANANTLQTTTSAITDADRSFWSFQALQVAGPTAKTPWTRTAVDRFILDKLRDNGRHPNPSADRRTLIRRAYFDLLGLPPTPEQIEAFITDSDPQAWEKLIDDLLKSDHYGERWARHWMDVARFAESSGFEHDSNRPFAYHYRDFLIRAFNDDMPYDQFVRWQLAGDELAPDDPLAMRATGFLGAGVFPTQLTEAEFESARYDELDDIVATTGVAFLGLSIGCARCHDHKFDPIPTVDYYRLAASFTKTVRAEIEVDVDPVILQSRRRQHQQRLQRLEQDRDMAPQTRWQELTTVIEEHKAAAPAEREKVQVNSAGLPRIKHHADGRGYPHCFAETHILARGDVHQKQQVATQSFLQVLMPPDRTAEFWRIRPPEDWQRTSFQRASLANWITDNESGAGHLAARVIVNRLWQHHFGRGIVATPNDFGFQGERPTHPELLDWLASELIANGWRLKPLHKLLMTSNVYRQSSAFDERRAIQDRENRNFWRYAPRRLEGEAIRDAMLAVAGTLDRTMYGPGTLDTSMRRRSIYFMVKRSQLIPDMMLFDWPEHLVSIGQRATTTVAPQALLFLNGPRTRRYAESLAQRVEGDNRTDSIAGAFRLALGREPSARELDIATSFLERQTALHLSNGLDRPADVALADFCQTMFSMNEFIYVD